MLRPFTDVELSNICWILSLRSRRSFRRELSIIDYRSRDAWNHIFCWRLVTSTNNSLRWLYTYTQVECDTKDLSTRRNTYRETLSSSSSTHSRWRKISFPFWKDTKKCDNEAADWFGATEKRELNLMLSNKCYPNVRRTKLLWYLNECKNRYFWMSIAVFCPKLISQLSRPEARDLESIRSSTIVAVTSQNAREPTFPADIAVTTVVRLLWAL